MERIRHSCGFLNGKNISTEGFRGGLCLAWQGNLVVSINSYSIRHVDVNLDDSKINKKWRLTGFYGSPYARNRIESWDMLRGLEQMNNLPLLVCRDFNEILYAKEKKEGLPKDERCMKAFRAVLEDCQLVDVGFSSSWFTWERGNFVETNVRE